LRWKRIQIPSRVFAVARAIATGSVVVIVGMVAISLFSVIYGATEEGNGSEVWGWVAVVVALLGMGYLIATLGFAGVYVSKNTIVLIGPGYARRLGAGDVVGFSVGPEGRPFVELTNGKHLRVWGLQPQILHLDFRSDVSNAIAELNEYLRMHSAR
jgi:hypothetical protein